jgi:tetratricopeptide (TPR) repeat protein
MCLLTIFIQFREAFQPLMDSGQRSRRSLSATIAVLSLIGLAAVGCQRNTESVKTMLERATVLNDRERFDEALALLENAIQADRGNADAYYLRGVAYENLQRFDQALEAYSQCLRIQPDHTEAFNNRGVVHGRMGNLDLAAGDLARAVELNPDDALAWSNLGLAYHEIGDLDSAVKYYSEASKRSNSPQILYQRGNSYLAAKRFQNAIDDYSRAIENDSMYSHAYLNRAIAYFRSGDMSSAAADLDRAEQFDNDMSITPLVHNLRESLDQRTARSKAVDVVRDWLERSGWEVNSDESCPVDFAASRLPNPIDPSAPEVKQPPTDSIPEDFYAVVLIKEADAGIVSNYELIESAMNLADREQGSASEPVRKRLCLFVVDVTQLGNGRSDPSTGQPFWLLHANYDWRPTADDFETSQVRLKLAELGLAP